MNDEFVNDRFYTDEVIIADPSYLQEPPANQFERLLDEVEGDRVLLLISDGRVSRFVVVKLEEE